MPLGRERFRVQFTGRAKRVEKLKKAQDLTGCSNDPDAIAALMEEALDLLIASQEKRVLLLIQPQSAAEQSALSVHGTFPPTFGGRCGEMRHVEFHHKQPWAKGGEHSVKNITLLCSAHNRLMAEQDFGTSFMDRKIIVTGDGGHDHEVLR